MLHLRNLKVIVWMLIIAICCFGSMATAGGPPAKKIGPNSDVQMRSASIAFNNPKSFSIYRHTTSFGSLRTGRAVLVLVADTDSAFVNLYHAAAA